jgi:hypothetical protein
MIKSTATRASNLHTCRCGARADGVGGMVNIHRPLAIVLLLFFAGVAEGSRVGVYRAWESAQLRRVATELWTPEDLDGLAAWYDAADASTLWADTEGTVAATNNGLVARWDDKSTNQWHVTQGTEELRPRREGDLLSFWHTDTGLRRLENTSVSIAQPAIHAGVYRLRQSNDFPTMHDGISIRQSLYTATDILCYHAGSGVGGTLLTSINEWFIPSAFFSGASSILNLDGVDTGAGNPGTQSLGGLRFGNRRDSVSAVAQWRGDARELVISSSNNTSDLRKLEGYMAHKWGLTDNLPANHPYKSKPPTK